MLISERRVGRKRLEADVSVGNLRATGFYTKAGYYPYWYLKNYMWHDGGFFYRMDFQIRLSVLCQAVFVSILGSFHSSLKTPYT